MIDYSSLFGLRDWLGAAYNRIGDPLELALETSLVGETASPMVSDHHGANVEQLAGARLIRVLRLTERLFQLRTNFCHDGRLPE